MTEDVPIDAEPETPAGQGADQGEWDEGGGGLTRQQTIRIAQVGLVVLALIVVGIVVFANKGGDDESSDKKGGNTSTTAADGSTGSTKADWPRNVGGRPPALGKRNQTADKVTPGPAAKPGVYLWNDFDGWHLWVVKGDGVPAITGSMVSNAAFGKAVSAIEGNGKVTMKDKTVAFELPVDVPLSGVDFNPGFYGKQVVITLNSPNGPVDQKIVHIGSKMAPAPFPLVISKVPVG